MDFIFAFAENPYDMITGGLIRATSVCNPTHLRLGKWISRPAIMISFPCGLGGAMPAIATGSAPGRARARSWYNIYV